jgi:hypothetical protein
MIRQANRPKSDCTLTAQSRIPRRSNPSRESSPCLSESPVRALPTVRAARYLGISTSLLRKLRLRGRDDPRGPGPEFIRLSPSLVVYEVAALDEWLERHTT